MHRDIKDKVKQEWRSRSNKDKTKRKTNAECMTGTSMEKTKFVPDAASNHAITC